MSSCAYGILGFGQALGEAYSVEEAVSKYTANIEKIKNWGYKKFYVAPPEVSQTDLALEASEEALKNSGMNAEDIDYIALAVSEVPTSTYWDPACELQHKLGAVRAEVQVFNQACTSGLMAFDAIAGKFAIHPEYKNVLIVTANRFCDDHKNRATYNDYLHSDGAVAAVLKRNHNHCKWITTETASDGMYAPILRDEWRAAVTPFDSGITNKEDSSTLPDLHEQLMDFFKLIHIRNKLVVEYACQKAGIELSDLKKVIYLHDNESEMKDFAIEFNVPMDQTNANLASQFSHMGASDQLIGLKYYIESGELQGGDYAALIGIGSGMHWVCTLIQV
ncbi:3-oxoacyl-ACP synthase III family protein [Chengkuizengella axinellae]|uniref:3-oxoacyl-[acyl-carrier-protein] synthase III C-terminal domain-containing protein n=1 Tax=Chengkuizengella axinellae TaxID=3064388 RepID=A0ABT9J2Z8_9BACL|nr:3-oxoacyl-[acyl-carrier-protein] synthase III C-terminal domain-containing protein [Chengkuizengella sp. 2205SS18-9]MDP5275986.1 3-oxoacyl-[acyl-carrier-protein] synthase III C-terminal domain-containing protein [Chengkuizengella sp. 2205SS18-9]